MWPALVAIFEKSSGDDLQKVLIFFSFKGSVSVACAHTHTHTYTHQNLIFLGGNARHVWGQTDFYGSGLLV